MKNEKLFMIVTYPIIIIVALVAFIFLATPIVLYSFPHIHKFFIASTFAITPHAEMNLTAEGLAGRTFYITVGSSTVFVWHLVPSKDPSADNPDEYDRILANDTYKIVVFFHSPERDQKKFTSFCRVLMDRKEQDIQLISFDYKGFGNAAGDTTVSGAVEDTRTVYNWLRRRSPHTEIHFWAHGLGGSIAAAALEALLEDGQEVKSIVLETPYPNTTALLKSKFFVVKMYDAILPSSFFSTSLNILDLNFNMGRTMASTDVPTLVLSGEADEEATSNARDVVRTIRRHRDFIFHIEWRCRKVTRWPGQQASESELNQIIRGFHSATDIFWAP
ncbi:hypothetical protein PRIPAC_92763 [Pristionchus pacificus]|uniref:Hydrolase n=1 Tax=Pristionchus pacificus TaxID=54126 RepID=A0A2A6CDW4_PRIPA|nr:hypothetical protein PRIPAC_92763 [Pristionchus pacificus]|eukprot:PDM76306.1 hydrolase [Pristionchus pacificus]